MLQTIANAISDPITGPYVAGGAIIGALAAIAMILHGEIKANLEYRISRKSQNLMRGDE
jgi:hypothetical protein